MNILTLGTSRRNLRLAVLLAAGSLSIGTGFVAAPAYADRVTLPSGTVIPLKLNVELSSKENRPGDKFTAKLRTGKDDAGLPPGTYVTGVVRESLPSADGKPGVLDLDFQRIVLSNSDSRPLEGQLVSLDLKSVKRDENGRLTAAKSDDRLKFVGIGAGAGFLISRLTNKSDLTNTLLGAGAGYLFDQLVNKKKPGDVTLKPGAEFGVRLERSLTFNTSYNGGSYNGGSPRDDRGFVAPNRDSQDSRDRVNDERNYDRRQDNPVNTDGVRGIGVLIDDREVRFRNARPYMRNSVVFVPFDAVSQDANLNYRYDASARTVRSSNNSVRVAVGSRIALVNGERRRLEAAPELRNGVVYVPMQFVGLMTGGSAYFDKASQTVVVTSRR